ncbi:hypothetical protein [Virgibacillus tibetensis]
MKKVITVVLITILILMGCNDHGYGGLLNRSQVEKLYDDADLIELEDGTVYINGPEWIEEQKLTKGDKIGIVEEGMATKLPEGAIIYESKESQPILIVEYQGETKRYLLASGE